MREILLHFRTDTELIFVEHMCLCGTQFWKICAFAGHSCGTYVPLRDTVVEHMFICGTQLWNICAFAGHSCGTYVPLRDTVFGFVQAANLTALIHT
jgi:hypothetical protein